MKKKIYISLAVLGSLGLSYFLFRKIRDLNKQIIKEGSFTIKVANDATTTTDNTDTDSYDSDLLDEQIIDGISEYLDSEEEAPIWSSNEYDSGSYV